MKCVIHRRKPISCLAIIRVIHIIFIFWSKFHILGYRLTLPDSETDFIRIIQYTHLDLAVWCRRNICNVGIPPPPCQISFRGVMDLRMLLYMAAKGLVTRLQIMSTALRTLHSAHCVQLCCIKLPASNVGSAAIATHSHHTVCTV